MSGPSRWDGFSLLELVVAAAIVAILLTLAVPAFDRQRMRVQRAEAVQALTRLAQCLERHHAAVGRYGGHRCLPGHAPPNYELVLLPLGDPDDSHFELRATPRFAQAGDPCGTLWLATDGRRGADGVEPAERCWALR
ncbi:MAG: type IV pilin protein [Xanthomonadales bacterium]|nr:type IV pilin protein [Xanthomonadales bacterium]